MTYETTATLMFALSCLAHGWYVIRCHQADYAQIIPFKVFFPLYCVSCVLNFLILGVWLEWFFMFAVSAVAMIPISYVNWKALWAHEGAMRVAAMQAELDRARAARPVQPERSGRTFRYFDPEPKRLN